MEDKSLVKNVSFSGAKSNFTFCAAQVIVLLHCAVVLSYFKFALVTQICQYKDSIMTYFVSLRITNFNVLSGLQ